MNYEEIIKKQTTIIVTSIAVMLILVIGSSYALFFRVDDSNEQIIETGDLLVQLSSYNGSSVINGSEYPMADDDGLEQSAFAFSVNNNGSLNMKYNIFVYPNPDVSEEEMINPEYIRISVDDHEPISLNGDIVDGKYLVKSDIFLESGEYNVHTIKAWIDADVPASEDGKKISLKVYVEGEQYDPVYGSVYITSLLENNPNMYVDDYGNVRYGGVDANNYMEFNGEEWRVVGVMKDMEVVNDDGTTSKQDLIKIVRNGTLGNIQWDSKNENDWTNATLMNRLNGDYLNGGETYTSTSTIKSLANVSDYIANVRWNIGGHDQYVITPKNIYPKERGTVGGGKNPSVTTWDGKVALLYPSDYGYSVSGNDNTENSNNCLNTTMSIWNSNGCAAQTWFQNEASQFLLTTWSGNTNFVFSVDHSGYLDNYFANITGIGVRPAVYLRADIRLTGTGEQGANAFRILE